MCDMMQFPKTVEEFMEKYKIVDTDEVYTNGAELVPIFRMKQWFEYKGQEKMPAADAVEVVRKWCDKRNCIIVAREDFPRLLEERHGRWEHYEHREPQYDIMGVKTWAEAYKCSNCGFIHTVIEDFGHYAFCPNCGAKIDEVAE